MFLLLVDCFSLTHGCRNLAEPCKFSCSYFLVAMLFYLCFHCLGGFIPNTYVGLSTQVFILNKLPSYFCRWKWYISLHLFYCESVSLFVSIRTKTINPHHTQNWKQYTEQAHFLNGVKCKSFKKFERTSLCHSLISEMDWRRQVMSCPLLFLSFSNKYITLFWHSSLWEFPKEGITPHELLSTEKEFLNSPH